MPGCTASVARQRNYLVSHIHLREFDTAISIFCGADAAHLVTDYAQYDGSGTVIGFAPKAWPLPHISAVVASTGPQLMSMLFVKAAGEADCKSFDDLRGRAVQIARETDSVLRALEAFRGRFPTWKLIVAGISESDGPTAFMIQNESGFANAPEWSVIKLGRGAMFPTGAYEMDGMKMLAGLDITPHEDDTAEIFGLRCLEFTRLIPCPLPEGSVGHIVGGAAQILSIRDGNISTKILHRWPDEIGHKIEAAQ